MNSRLIHLDVHSRDTIRPIAFPVRNVVIAGWTGRDAAHVQAHIDELAALGVAPPATTPIFYRVSRDLITSDGEVQLIGPDTSGEVEAVLFIAEEGIFVGIGSDHTDRKLESVTVTQSKQVCAKPVGAHVWLFSDVQEHWDELVLESQLNPSDGAPYQSGSTSNLRRPEELLALYRERGGDAGPGTVMFCGTMPVIGEIRFTYGLDLRLKDPVLGRELNHRYCGAQLPIVG
jgi:hypothetical protein